MTDAPKNIPIEPKTAPVETAKPDTVGPVVEATPVEAPAVEKK